MSRADRRTRAVVVQENGELTESTLHHEAVDGGRRDGDDDDPVRRVRHVTPMDEDEETQVPPTDPEDGS